MNQNFEQAKKLLNKYHQEHIINFLDNEQVIEQVLNIDFEKIDELYSITKEKNIIDSNAITPIYGENINLIEKEKLENYSKIGQKIISEGKYAVSIMAGGQGTRLGHNGPKGTFKVSLENEDKYLFQIITEKLIQISNKYNVIIPCYIMTSDDNNEETITLFENNNYFGYDKKNIMFFKQEELPLLDEQGKLLIGENGIIRFASEGNGGIFYSMQKKGIISDLKKRKIEWLFVGSVDNILLQLADEILLGLTIKENNEIASKTILKSNPFEKVGVFCKYKNKVKVIEYTELPTELAVLKNDKNEVIYGESHIMCNLFKITALEKLANCKMPYHVAHKKNKFMDEDKTIVIPEKENSYKFEKFIFDGFSYFDEISILRAEREENFAPIKNKCGIDSPETAIKLYNKYNSKIMEKIEEII